MCLIYKTGRIIIKVYVNILFSLLKEFIAQVLIGFIYSITLCYFGGGHGNQLQYSCLDNHMGREAWQATVHEATQSGTQLSDLVHRLYYLIYLIMLNRKKKKHEKLRFVE